MATSTGNREPQKGLGKRVNLVVGEANFLVKSIRGSKTMEHEPPMRRTNRRFVNFKGRVMRIVFVLLLGMFFASIPALAQSNRAPAVAEYRVQAGDILDISVWKEPDLERIVLVRPDGRFSFPLVGDVVAIEKSVETLRQELTERLSVFIPDLVVTVSIQEILGNKIYVLGQVNNPGQFVVNPSVDIMQALSMAGGTTAFAALNDIIVLRRSAGSSEAISFRYADVARGRCGDDGST